MTAESNGTGFFSSIPARLAFRPLILLFIAFAAAGAAFYLLPEFSSLRAPQVNYLSAVTIEKKTAADFWFREHIAELESISKQPVIKFSAASIAKEADTVRKAKPRKTAISRTARAEALASITALLKDKAAGEYINISLINTDGIITASSDPSAAGAAWSGLDSIGRQMAALRSPLVRLIGTSLQKDLEILVPVTDADGEAVSALLAKVSTSRLLSLMKIDKPLYSSLNIEITDQSGRIVFGQSGFDRTSTADSYSDSKVYVSTKKLQYAPLSIVGKVSRAEAAAALRLLAIIYFSFMAFLVLLMLYIYLRGRRLVTKPVMQLAEAADAYSSGDAFITDGARFRGELLNLKNSMDRLISRMSEKDATHLQAAKQQEITHARARLMSSFSGALHNAAESLVSGVSAMRSRGAEMPSASKSDLLRISAVSEQLESFVSVLKDMAELERGEEVFSPAELNIRVLYNEVVKEAAALSEARHLTFVAELGDVDDAPAVYADAFWLRKLVLGALGNSFQNTDLGTVTLMVSRIASEDNSSLMISIADTGSGMDEESLSMLDAGTLLDPRYIQIALSRRITQLMSGSFSVENIAGKGLSVIISIPLKAV
ncbi:MAG: sensor histidine kinase [Nitrospiraceae bacterium]|nr:sensor histidine kinase [Nitrospiraceae bacterium]